MKKKFIFCIAIIAIVASVLVCTGCDGITISVDAKEQPKVEGQTDNAVDEDEISDEEYRTLYVGKKCPSFKMKNLNGNLVDFDTEKGPFIIYFARTDCEDCDKVYPQIQELKNNYKVISVYRRNGIEELKAKYPDCEDDPYILSGVEDEENNNVLEVFNLQWVPTVYFVDSNHIVKDIEIGEEEKDYLKIAQDNI